MISCGAPMQEERGKGEGDMKLETYQLDRLVDQQLNFLASLDNKVNIALHQPTHLTENRVHNIRDMRT